MKKNDLVRVIREIVRQEIKKELPNALSQVFQNLMGKKTIEPETKKPASSSSEKQTSKEEVDETNLLKSQLREMFNGNAPIQRTQPVPERKFTSNPVLNEVLNNTRPFNGSEKMAMRAGGGLVMSPGVAMAASRYNIPSSTSAGEMMEDSEVGFMRGIPEMPGASVANLSSIPVGNTVNLREGQEGGSAPLESLGEVSALDIKNHPALPENIKNILNRDYRSLVRAMDKK